MFTTLVDPGTQPDWLIRNYGPRCTLVCVASIVRKFMSPIAEAPGLVDKIAARTGYCNEPRWFNFFQSGTMWTAYVGNGLDKGVKQAATECGVTLKSGTRWFFRFSHFARSIDAGVPVAIHCLRAPSRRKSHSVLVVGYNREQRQLLTLDPNDAVLYPFTWGWTTRFWIWCATFVSAR